MIEEFDGFVPQIESSAWVHPNATVIGEVTLGKEVSVWPSAVLRGDMGAVIIGDHTNIQDGVVCHDTGGLSQTVVGSRVTVGHNAILHGCIVEDDCLIGMGSIILDNAVIGRGSMVGAGAVVLANRVIPPNSLVLGSPGKVKRELTQDEQGWINDSWQIYQGKARKWRKA